MGSGREERGDARRVEAEESSERDRHHQWPWFPNYIGASAAKSCFPTGFASSSFHFFPFTFSPGIRLAGMILRESEVEAARPPPPPMAKGSGGHMEPPATVAVARSWSEGRADFYEFLGGVSRRVNYLWTARWAFVVDSDPPS